MEITPIDIQQYQFKNRFMGYEKTGVDQFLEKVAEQLENLHRENQELKENLARTRQSLEDMRQTESTLKEALLTTQQVTDGLRQNARKEAELIVEDARLKAGKIVSQGEQRRVELIEQIQEINRQKLVFETNLKSLIERHQRMLAETDWPQIPEALMVVERPLAGKFPSADGILATDEENLEPEANETFEEMNEEIEEPGEEGKEAEEDVKKEDEEEDREASETTREFNREWDV
ncbi:MAG: DivIVA domain-containing protein [Deltaproteobacteria bacterium]|nr:DivIVA domain-containing protein [Deltaproteobacteria bacterium]